MKIIKQGENVMKNKVKEKVDGIFEKKIEAIGVVELILILVIVIGLVLIFKDQITEIINDAFDAISGGTSNIIG